MRPGVGLAGSFIGGIAPASWFTFISAWTLSRGCRRNDYTSLITIHARREFVGTSADVGLTGLIEVAEVAAGTIRTTDLIGELADGGLGILVSDADEAAVCRLVQRIADALGTVQFSATMTFVIGIGLCPTHGVDLPTLLSHAESHPSLIVRAAAPVSAGVDRAPCASVASSI